MLFLTNVPSDSLISHHFNTNEHRFCRSKYGVPSMIASLVAGFLLLGVGMIGIGLAVHLPGRNFDHLAIWPTISGMVMLPLTGIIKINRKITYSHKEIDNIELIGMRLNKGEYTIRFSNPTEVFYKTNNDKLKITTRPLSDGRYTSMQIGPTVYIRNLGAAYQN